MTKNYKTLAKALFAVTLLTTLYASRSMAADADLLTAKTQGPESLATQNLKADTLKQKPAKNKEIEKPKPQISVDPVAACVRTCS